MELNTLTAISPIDGRYRNKVTELAAYFSEFALIQYRIRIEVEYFIALVEVPLPQLASFDKALYPKLRSLYLDFNETGALRVKEIEKTTNHDVKAVEYFIKEQLADLQIGQYLEFIHFGLTSQDVNNTAIPLSLKEFNENILFTRTQELLKVLGERVTEWGEVSMLARTHGQPASPTKLGKEFLVFVERLSKQLQMLKAIPYACKFGGATGNFNAHHVAYPQINWVQFSNNFTASLGLSRSQYTTQIEHYDMLAAYCDNMKRINNIILDLDRDVWTYISMDYFKQKTKAGEVGSSAMPHEVNPIDFENSEGNIGIANALFEHLAAKLPISRLQRDLTDSTVLRNLGVPAAHTLIAIDSTLRGLGKLLLNETALLADLNKNIAVLAEAIQTILRREDYPQPYEKLKELTRGKEMNADTIHEFITGLDVSEDIKQELYLLTPANYTGVF
jgi:adenylosuccinate lyase